MLRLPCAGPARAPPQAWPPVPPTLLRLALSGLAAGPWRHRGRVLPSPHTTRLGLRHTHPGALLPPTHPQRLSHLFANPGTIVGAFLRIDIPQLKEFHQYNYVLFTGGWTGP